ncbi:hypothetical protein ASC87_13260 [Rhizobacter sp. Root1221]|nr:hypothetical protein ASC87_13260 [Rhizobacter sp. Root1221]
MKVRYFEKRGNTWADFRINGDRKRMDTGAPWGDQKGAEAAMPRLIAKAMQEQQEGTSRAAALSNGPSSRTVAVMHEGPSLKDAFKLGMKVREQWIASKDKKTIGQTFEAIVASTDKLTMESPCGILTRDFVRELRAVWLKAPGKRQGTTLSHSTINHRLSLLSALLEVCDLPPHTVKHLSTKGRNRKRRVSDAEVGAMQGWLRGSKKKGAESMCALITLGLEVGARQSELLDLDWRDVRGDEVTFRETKNGETRTVPLSPVAHAVLEARRSLTAPFSDLDQDRVTALWDEARRGIGLQDDTEFVFHALRHEFGSRLSDKGESAFTIMVLMGHADISTTQVYVKASMGALRRAVGAAPPADSVSAN